MLTPEDDILIKQETSCSKEEAVAKLLGWMRGVKRRKYVEFTPGFISEDQLPYLYSLHGTVQDLLQDLRTDAHAAYYEAAIIDPSIDAFAIAEEKREAVERYDKLIDDAASYLRDIERELDKGDDSVLRIDHGATGSVGVIQLTLSSLDRWSHQQYGFSIFDPPSSPPIVEDAVRKQSAQASSGDPCWIADERDPEAVQPWYTPARYYARQLVRERPALLSNRELLAKEVVTALDRVGIKKRGGKKPFEPGTVKKAFVNVVFS